MINSLFRFIWLSTVIFLSGSISAEEINIQVSGGQFGQPYFNFSDEDGTIDIATYEFHAGNSYSFTAEQGFNPHPFQIGSEPGTPSQYSSDGPLNAIGDELVLSIPTDFDPYSSSLYFYCTAHTSMSGELTVVASGGSAHNNDNDGNNEPSESLDGSVIHITGEDSVKETLIFENGTVTSIFDEGEGQTPFTTEDLSYSIEDDASGHLVIIDGDLHYLFYESNGTGNLLDYSNNGQLDESGSWGFSYVIHEWEEYDDFSSGSLDPEKWDVWWGAGGELPTVVNGALKLSGTGNEDYPASSVIPDDLTYTENLPSKHSVALINQDDIYGLQAEFMIPSNPSDDTGLNFIFFDWASDGSNNGFGPELEYRSNSGLRTEFAWTDPDTGVDEQITRSAQFDTYYKMSLIHTDSTNSMYLNGELIKEFSSAGFAPDTIGFAAFNDDGLPYTTYVKNVRVLRRQGENSGHDEGNETISPEDGDSILSDSNGNPIVNQEGNEYRWNDTLDGVTIWLVGYDSGELIHATMKYENGQVSGNFELIDEVTNPESSINYFVNDQGNLVWEESNGYQYFQIHSVIDGRIEAIGFMNDSGTVDNASEPSEFFFTNRAAAEEFYNLKLNEGETDPINENNQSEYFVPQSIAGGILTAQDENWSVYNEEINFYDNQTFNAVIENDAESPLNASGSYEYSVNSNGSASLFYTVQSDDETNGYSFAYDLVFSASNQGTYTKTANYNGETDITTGPFTLILDSTEGDNGNQNDGNQTEDESVPVFFLSSSVLLELTGEEGLAEGNYAISEDYEWNEETQSEEFGFWIEPAEESETGDWVYAGGETEDGYLIVESYQGEDLLRQYFDDNQLSEVGQITDFHDEEDESDPINENNQSEYYVPQSIAGALLTAQDENWSVYNEEINFYENQTFNAVIENDSESPLSASGSYEYSVNSNGSASLFYTVQSDDETNGYSFSYDLVFSTSNQGTYTKTANYNGETDITTGPFTLILDSSEGDNDNQNDGNETEDKSVPVFFLTSSVLLELTGEEGLAEGNYAISEDYEWNEETQSEEFGFWIEPAEESESGDWVYAGGETEDGYLIVESYQGEDLLRQYFDDNQLSEVGQITDFHDEEDESDPINENNQSEYYVPQSITGALLTAQDENWSVYNEEINFYENQTFNAVIKNDAESPLIANGSYEYSVNNNGSASLFYTVQSEDETNGYSFSYDLVFSTSNQGTYTKTANYNGETDITTGPFTLILDSNEGGSGNQNDDNETEDDTDHDSDDHGSHWEQYDDFSQLTPSSAGGDYAPDSIVGFVININLNFTEGIEEQTDTYFKDRKVFHNGDGDWTYYDYVKTSENQATITYTFEDESDPMPEVVNLTFTSPTGGTFDWAEYTDTSLSTIEDETTGDFSLVGFIDPEKWDLAQWDGGMVPVIENGKMKFSGQPNSSESVGVATTAMLEVDSDAGHNEPDSTDPHSILEFVESQGLSGIELTFSLPSNSPTPIGFGLYAVDYSAMYGASSEEDEMNAMRFALDLWNENGSNPNLQFSFQDPGSDEETYIYRDIELDTNYRVSFIRGDTSASFYLNDDLIGEYPYDDREEYFIIRAMNKVNQPFSTYLENVRVMRRGHDNDITPPGDDHDDEFTPIEEVEEFVNELKNSIEELTYSDAVWVEKKHDALVDGRFVYEVGLNNMINLYFDQNGSYIHAAEDYMEERQFIPKSEISQSIKDLILAEVPNSEIIDFEVEFSRINVPGNDNQIFFAVIENNQSESFEVVISGDGERVIIVMPFDDVIPWRPVELPEVAVQYLAENYVYEDGYPMNYWEDQRPTPDGNSMEFVAYLEDGREVIFDEDGSFNREFDPWNIEEDAKLSFNDRRSAWGDDLSTSNFNEGSTGGSNSAYVHIEKLDLSQNHGEEEGEDEHDEEGHEDEEFHHFGEQNWDDLVYRISLVNSALGEDANLSVSNLELGSTEIPAGTPLKLTFTYEMGEPRYILVSGANIRGFKRTWPEWDRPGTFTILAETVDAVSTTEGDLESTFGMVVVMGGERFYNGAIFQANVPVLDLKPSEFIPPYDQVAAFSLGAEVSSDVNVSAFLPRDLLEWNFGISEPHLVKAGLMDENGSLLFINGSGADDEGAQFTGGGFTRIIHKGHEPDFEVYPQSVEDEDYKLGDHDSDEGFIDENEDSEDGVIKSRFDFNADGFGDSLLEVRFVANAFPAEVGFGDPYEDPYKDLNEENMGSITGSVLDEDGQVIPEFGLWFFQAPDGLEGAWEPAFFTLDTNFSTGSYEAHLPEGNYYVEAWAYNPDTGTPYKPQISESSFVITDASSSHTLDFALEQDFVVSHEYGQVSSNLSVSGLGSDDRLDISIELYPVEQNGSRITDYPTGWLWVEPNGEISGEAASGRYEVVLFSYDNSVRLSGGPIFWDITANVLNVFDALQATMAQPLEVSGVVYDADTSFGIWADIVFVDPSDEHREFWPEWEPVEFEDTDSYVEGSYSVKIPAGTYKIKAMRWDGLYQSEYYTNDGVGTTEFSDADSVVIDSDRTDIDFNLSGAPAAQVLVRIVDANTSDAVEFAWFAFFDAEDEYGPVIYPHVLEDDGNYSLKLPGGNYKVMVEAGGYEPKFLTSDADGNYIWDSSDWSSSASLNLTEGNLTSLSLAELNAFVQEDHERYAFEWFDEDAEITFGTISGKVVTTKGNTVPKARIVAHTDDYLFWFDHFETKVDGTYELNNLPAGNWIVFAEPPFESEEYLGYQSSLPNWDLPILVDANTTTDIKLTLQGSNVSGRIMYPKKNEDTGRVRLVGLQHAFLWVFQDENETGEPNYNHVEGEAFVFNEAYGETNEDGFFALSLPEAGKYSMRIELPGNLANLALAPVHFELKNPAKEMRLGNAIRIDWSKAEARATTYKLERKLSSASVYSTLDDNISGSAKSYVDYTVVPGAAYDYKLTAVTTNGSKAIGDSSYKVSKPFIYLAPPSKTISGQIRDDLNATVTGAEVVAWRMDGEGWANTFSDTSGGYELSVGPGKWDVTVYRPWDQNVNWSYDKAPKTVSFTNNSSKTTKTVNFSVNRMGDGKVVGTIDIPDGITDAASSIWIDVFSPDGIGNWANPESNGSFSIPLKPGQYELSVWLDPDKFKGYGSPEPQFIRVGKSEVSVGTISLSEFNSTISGVIATFSGSPLGNAEVWAWSETGGWTSDVTDTTGAFELKVAPGRWEVGFNPPIPADGSESPYLLEPPKRIKVGDGVKTLNFTVRKAASKVEGIVYGPSGAPVADLNAWAYAREVDDGTNSEEFFEVLAEVAISPRGTFSFPGLPGTYSIGLWIPPGSDYAQPDEQILSLSETGVITDPNGTQRDKVEFTLAKVDSYVTGSLVDKDTNQSITGLVGEVYAMRTDGDGWQYAPIETNGTYSMLLPPGNWVVEYYLEYDDQNRNYPKASAQPLEVSLQQSESIERNFILSAASASISGAVVYDSNSSTVSESTLYVWAYREGSASFPEYWDEVETDDNGSFTISVLQGGKYEVGVILSNDLREDDYLEPAIQKFKMSTSTKTGLEFRLAQPEQDNYLSGTVVDSSGNELAGAYVYAWTYDGRESSAYADSNGDFNMTVPSGALWKLGAEYSEFDANDDEILYLPENDAEADLRKNEFVSGISIILTRPEFEVPDGISITFDPSKDFVTTLPDGTEITIPGGAANVSSDVKTIRLVVTPTAKGLDKSGTDKPADYAYSMELFDDKGKEIEGNFKKDVVIRIPVDVDSFRKKGIDLDTLEGMYYSPTKKAWAKAKTSTFDQQSGKLTMTTDHFTVNSLVGQTAQSDLVADANTSSLTGYDNWYQSDWLGSFFDASADKPDWVFHVEEKLGWMWVKTDAAANYWFYHTSRGWLWTGEDYFVEGDDSKSHFYSFSLGRWLYFHPQNGFYDYEVNGGSYLE